MINLEINMSARGWNEADAVAQVLEQIAERIREEGDDVAGEHEAVITNDTLAGIMQTDVCYSISTS